MWRPLAGVKIADFCWEGTGPFGTELLAWLGAEVVRVETRTRADGLRRYAEIHAWTAGDSDLDASPYFNEINLNKRSVGIDLKSPEGRDLVRPLLERSDVVTENMRPGVFERLVGDFSYLQSVRSDVVWASLSALGGGSEPMAGYAAVFAAMGGLSDLSGYQDGPPAHCRLDVDFSVGCFFALGIVAALDRRDLSGRAQRVDLSCQEVCASLIGDAVVAAGRGQAVPARGETTYESYSLIRCYKCAGEDSWVHVVAESVDDLMRLASIVGSEQAHGLSPDATLLVDSVDRAVAEWASRRDKHAVSAELQGSGLSCVPAMTMADLAADDVLQARNFWGRVKSSTMGELRVCNPPWIVEREARIRSTAGPVVGEDTIEYARRVVGLEDHSTATLIEDGSLEAPRSWIDELRTPADLVRDAPEARLSDSARRTGAVADTVDGGGSDPVCGALVLELPESHSSAYAARLLRDLGASVVRVNWESSIEGPKSGVSGLAQARDAYENSGKIGLAIDPEDEADFELLKMLWRDAGVVLAPYSSRTESIARRLADHASCDAGQPAILWTSVFGKSARQSIQHVSPVSLPYAAGQAYMFPPTREVTTAPPGGVWEMMPHYSAGACVALLACGLLRSSGMGASEPRVVDFSMREYVIHLAKIYSARYYTTGFVENRWSQAHPWAGIFPCSDGYIAMLALKEHQWKSLLIAMGRRDLVSDERFGSPSLRADNAAIVRDLVVDWTDKRTRAEVIDALDGSGVPTGPVRTPAEVLAEPNMRRRGFVRGLGSNGEISLGLPFVTTEPDGSPPESSPRTLHAIITATRIGSDTAAALGGRARLL
jgi:benzylsuccinate CoA-transferase BbsF subunit